MTEIENPVSCLKIDRIDDKWSKKKKKPIKDLLKRKGTGYL
jgi:hypothetical protein